MEKLEAALAKARQARKASLPPGAAEESIEHSSPLSRARAAAISTQVDWTGLPELQIKQDFARQMRLSAVVGGKDATPYDMLRSRAIRMMKEKGWKRLAITSPNAACGKTTVAANLALSLARQKDLAVMLIDVDLRRPALHKLLGHKPANSFHQVLTGEVAFEDHAVRMEDNLIILTNKSPVQNPAELLHSEKTRDIISAIEAKWKPDVMIFDMSPMLASDDNVGFLSNVECALLVAAAESTTVSNIDVCEKELAELTNVLGIVLNKCRYSDDAAGFGYEAYE